MSSGRHSSCGSRRRKARSFPITHVNVVPLRCSIRGETLLQSLHRASNLLVFFSLSICLLQAPCDADDPEELLTGLTLVRHEAAQLAKPRQLVPGRMGWQHTMSTTILTSLHHLQTGQQHLAILAVLHLQLLVGVV